MPDNESLHFLVPPECRILIVEDSGIQAKAFTNLLNNLGYSHVVACPNANIALEKLKVLEIDIIFCDWQMPGMTGLDLLHQVKSDANLASIPFVFLTAHADKEKVIEALKAGAFDYIVKPANEKIVTDKLTRIGKERLLGVEKDPAQETV